MTLHVKFDEKVSALAKGAAGMDVSATGDSLSAHAALIQIARYYPGLHLFNCEGEMRGAMKAKRDPAGAPIDIWDKFADGEALYLVVG